MSTHGHIICPCVHSFKTKLVHEINKDDIERSLQFCELMSERTRIAPKFVSLVIVVWYNCRRWSDDNPKMYHEVNTQHLQKMNV